MTDVLIRNVPEEDLRRIDAKAARLGLSRSEYLKRQIAQDAAGEARKPLTIDALKRFSELAADMFDEDFERRAWS